MLKALMGKENNMQEKIVYVNREMETKKEFKRNARIRNIVTEIKHASNGLIGRPEVPSKESVKISISQ